MLWAVVPVAAAACGLGLLAMFRILGPGCLPSGLPIGRLLALLAVLAAPMVLGGLAGTSLGVLALAAPIGLSMFLLMVPPLGMMLILMNERIRRSVERVSFEEVTGVEMPPAAVQWFESQTPEVLAMGFRKLGDYRLKRRSEHFARFFLHPDGRVIGELSWWRVASWRKIQCFSCESVSDGATYLETGNVAMPPETAGEDCILSGVPNATIAETYHAHCRRLEELARDRSEHPILLAEGDLQRVVTYGLKLLYDRNGRNGLTIANPYDGLTFQWSDRQEDESLVEAL